MHSAAVKAYTADFIFIIEFSSVFCKSKQILAYFLYLPYVSAGSRLKFRLGGQINLIKQKRAEKLPGLIKSW